MAKVKHKIWLEINDKAVANIKFEDGEKRIILKYAKIQIDE